MASRGTSDLLNPPRLGGDHREFSSRPTSPSTLEGNLNSGSALTLTRGAGAFRLYQLIFIHYPFGVHPLSLLFPTAIIDSIPLAPPAPWGPRAVFKKQPGGV